MTVNATPDDRQLALAPLDENVDHVRGAPVGHLSPLTGIHPHALAAAAPADRIRRDVGSGLASGHVLGTPTLFIDGVAVRGGYDPPALLAALAR